MQLIGCITFLFACRSHQDSSEANSDSDSWKHKKKKKHRSDGSDQEKPQRSQYRKQNSKSGDESDSSNKASKSNDFRGIVGRTYSQKQYSEEKEELSHKEKNSQTESGHYTSSEQHRGGTIVIAAVECNTVLNQQGVLGHSYQITERMG